LRQTRHAALRIAGLVLGVGIGAGLVMAILAGLVLGAIRADRSIAVGTALVLLVGAAVLGVIVRRRWAGWLAGLNQAIQAADKGRAELERAKLAAETANLAKSRYLANVSHEIRSPLNAIYGYAQLVERNEGVGAIEASAVIRRCAEHITSIVEALLDISQVENGVIRVKPEPVRFDQFIDQMLRMVKPSAASKGLEFHLVTQGRLPPIVRMDQSRLRQVLLNLLLNAIKYTDHGSVTLMVRYSAQMATFEVSDTGPGIREEDREAIFLPFERGGDEALRARPGVGLGLSIARAIVDMLGGKLELVASSAEGTVFRVTMTASHAQARPRREVSGYLGRRRSILICDDDAEQRKFLSELLDSLGFAVETVPNGETAVALVCGDGGTAPRQFDLAILDISLPGMSGWDVAGHLREALGQDFRILMLSANAQEFHRPETKAPVHDHFLVKPVEFNSLIETIGGLLDLAWGLESDGAKPIAPQVLTPTTLEPEAAAHATRIRELLRIGYLRGIEKEIRLLAEQPAMGDLASKLYACLDRFDLPGMAAILEEC
jgi:signal transduction histidine kinase/DNA-binding NarL/FixJ family response regulator